MTDKELLDALLRDEIKSLTLAEIINRNISIEELAEIKGAAGIGLELDMYWKPRPLKDCRND